MFAIYKRELRSYFSSPIGYIFIAVFLAVNGFLFSTSTLQEGADSSVSSYLTTLIFVFIVLIPLLTMRSLSEDRKLGTEQLLLTSPVSLPGMVLGKFCAAFTMFAGTFLLGCTNFYSLYKFVSEDGEINTAKLVGYVIGILLIGAAFTAVGIFMSSLTENQLIAAIGTIGVLLIFLGVGFMNDFIDSEFVRSILSWISVYSRFGNFTYGVFDFNAVLYYSSLSFVFLFLTVRVYEKRRWA